jgi:drug/metabolite transporter (DMT)-like permease
MKSLSTPLWGLIFGAIGIFSFSITLPMTVMALESLPPLFLGAGRACVAAAIAAVVLIATKTRRPTRNQWLHLAVVALGVVVGFPFLTSFALQYVPSAHGAVVIGLLPAATAVAAVIRGKERPSPLFWVASLSGALAVGVFSVVTSGAFTGPALGDLLLLAAVVMAAIGYAEGALLSRQIGSWQTISWALIVSLPVVVPLALINASTIDFGQISQASWVGFAYIAVVSMYLGFFAWYKGLAIGPMSRVSQIQLVQPILTVLWAGLFFGESIGIETWIGAVVIFIIAAIAVRARVSVKPQT